MSRNCGCSGVELPTASTLTEVEIKKLLEEVNTLLKDTQAQILCQNGKIAETVVYIKENLSLALQSLLDSMEASGEIDQIIKDTIMDLETDVSTLTEDTEKVYIYTPSLLNSVNSESVALVMNDNMAVLMDTGRDTTANSTKVYLQDKLCDRKLDAIIISHYHLDHTGGLATLLSLLTPGGKVYLPMDFTGYLTGTDDVNTLITIRNDVLSLLNNNNVSYEEISTDKTLTYNYVKIKLFNSNVNAYTYYRNNNSRYNAYSMNALVSIGENKALFPGDSIIDTQNYLMSVNQVEKVSIYASNHHGYERRANSEYLDILNPDYEYFSVSPLSWDDVAMTNYDYVVRNKPIQYSTEAFGEVEYVMTGNSAVMLKGYFCRENMFVNKRLDIYVNPSYSGIPDGSQAHPYRTLSQAISYLPKSETDVTIHLARGVYEDVRFMDISNLLTIETDNNDVTFKGIQINNCSAVYIRGCYITNLVASYGTLYCADCNISSEASTTGNIAVTLNRINASFGNCSFGVCYTGIYAQSGCQVTVKDCTFSCGGYAIYGVMSYIALNGYTLTEGTLRADTGCIIQAESRGNSANVPNFNNSNYMRGYMYYATNLGYPLFYFNDGGADHWRKADGTVVI